MRESAKVAGLPAFPIMYSRPGPVTYTDIYGKLYREGLRLVHLDATCGDDYYSPELRAWHGDGKFDYTVQADGWKRLIEVGPDFRFCLRVYVGSPAWWDDAHPTELQRYADGSSTREFPHTARTSVPSLASEVWRRDSCLAIARFLDWLQWSGWSQRVWGIFPCFGITWEWGILGTDGMPDYSEPMQRRFRAWLNEHYGDVDRLRAAWGDSSISFDSANIPDADSRFRGDGDLRQYPRDRASFDYQRCLSDANVELLNAYGEAIRAHSGDRYHVGAFYGYTLTAREHSFLMGRMGSGGLMGGHHSLARYEDGGVFDFIASPYAYSNRNLEDGVIMPHFPHAGTQARGLHGYEENDLHTFTNWMTINLPISVGQTGELRRSILHQRLAFASAVCRGASYWLTEITDSRRLGVEISNYSDETILAEVGRHIRAFDKLAATRRSSVAQIALIIDEESKDALALDSKLFLDEVYNQLALWAWCGAPYDVWLASDVTAETMERYRLAYVFAPYRGNSASESLTDALCRVNRTVWWGPGSSTEKDGAFSGPGTARHNGQLQIASAVEGLLRRDFGNYLTLDGACAHRSAADLAAIAREAGVHIYGASPVHIMAGAELAPGETAPLATVRVDLLTVHVNAPGSYPISLPDGAQAIQMRDVFSGKRLSAGGGFDFESLDVALFVRDGVAFPRPPTPEVNLRPSLKGM